MIKESRHRARKKNYKVKGHHHIMGKRNQIDQLYRPVRASDGCDI